MKKFLAAFILPILFVGGLSGAVLTPRAAAADCDSNAVMRCGASSVTQVANKYNGGDTVNSAASIQHIYSSFGIGAADIQAMGSTAQMGTVTKGGDVFIGDRQVASNAVTAGRQNMAGSTRHMNQGTIFFTRPPSVSFVSSPLTAFVVMKNGVFQFAILVSCGNPVIGHPKQPPQQPQPPKQQPPAPAKPVSKPKPVTKKPVKTCNGNTTNTVTNDSGTAAAAQGGNCSVNTVNNTTNTTNTTIQQQQTAAPGSATTDQRQEATSTTPTTDTTASQEQQTTPTEVATAGESAPAAETETQPAAPATTSSATTLPNTGPSSVGELVGIFAATAAVGTLGYRWLLIRFLRGL